MWVSKTCHSQRRSKKVVNMETEADNLANTEYRDRGYLNLGQSTKGSLDLFIQVPLLKANKSCGVVILTPIEGSVCLSAHPSSLVRASPRN
ncbi:unnamed protein product [Hymenolepis diminuta]|uniref:Uncharacterized protein n=1 Tax=Hymenolepis diminuta TaxID=6216 RepID=A0A0R3SZ72_HYMDI|nr:unnamed protein product [Hymenolepis diminuta]